MAPLKQRRMNVVVIHIDHFSLLHFLAKGSDSSAATAAAARSNKCITIIYFVVSSLHNSCSYCYNFSGSADSHQHRKLFIMSKKSQQKSYYIHDRARGTLLCCSINLLYFYFTSAAADTFVPKLMYI